MNEADDQALAADAITVTLNGEPQTLRADTTLAELLLRQGQPADGVATAVNGEFVPRPARAQRRLRSGDEITCFQAIVGG